jgi:hypothetical protein
MDTTTHKTSPSFNSQFHMAIINNVTQATIHTFSCDQELIETKIIDQSDLFLEPLSLVVLSNHVSLDQLECDLYNKSNHLPILAQQDIQESYSFDELKNLVGQSSQNWSLKNNLSTIEEMPKLVSHLKDLWNQDRTSFFEELWFIIKKNFATEELKIIFHDLQEDEISENKKKPRLINMAISGFHRGEFIGDDPTNDFLMKNFGLNPVDSLELIEFDREKGNWLFVTHINLSPIVIWGRSLNLSLLSHSILKGIISGLNN